MSTCQMEHGTWHGTCQLIRQVKWSGKYTHNSLFKYFQACLGFFRHTDGYSALSTGVQLGSWGEVSPALLWKSKKIPWFWKKALLVFWRVCKKKTTKCFPMGPFFLRFWRNIYRSALVPRNPSCPEKFWLRSCSQALFFL